MYKIRLQRHFFETCSRWMKWQDISVHIKTLVPGSCLPLPRGYIHVQNHEKSCINQTSKTFFWNLQQVTEVLTSKFCPQGVVSPYPGAIYMDKILKKLYKINFKKIFLKLVANDRSDKRFLLTSKFCPLGLSAHDLRLYTFIKSWKDVYKVEVEEILFKLQQMTIVMRPSCWHKNFGPNGLSAPAQGLCLKSFSSIIADFNISSALRWAIQDQWSSGLNLL